MWSQQQQNALHSTISPSPGEAVSLTPAPALWELLLLLMLRHLRSNKSQTNCSGLSSLLSKINGKIDFPWAKRNPGGFKPFKLIHLIPDGTKPSGYTRVMKEAADNYGYQLSIAHKIIFQIIKLPSDHHNVTYFWSNCPCMSSLWQSNLVKERAVISFTSALNLSQALVLPMVPGKYRCLWLLWDTTGDVTSLLSLQQPSFGKGNPVALWDWFCCKADSGFE